MKLNLSQTVCCFIVKLERLHVACYVQILCFCWLGEWRVKLQELADNEAEYPNSKLAVLKQGMLLFGYNSKRCD